MKRRAPIALVLLTITLSVRGLHAEEADPPEWAEAAKLLDEGRALMSKRGSLDEACTVLKKSYTLRKRGDTLLNLAECHRRQGKTATAWREFDEAIRYAKEADYSEAVRAAEHYRDQLSKTLSELVIEAPVEAERPKDLTVTLDGEPLPIQQWGQTLYVDPGPHQVAAKAPNYEPFSASPVAGVRGSRSVVQLKLVPLPPPPPKPQPAQPPPQPKPTAPQSGAAEIPIWAVVVGGVGVAMIGASIGFLVDSRAAGDELDDTCGGEPRNACKPGTPFLETYDREVRGFGLFVGLGAGGLAAVGVGATGLALGLAAPTSEVAVLPWATPYGAGVTLGGRF